MIPITAYRIELIAGFTFSSLPPERININHHHIMNNIAQSQPTRTINEIATRMMSLALYDEVVSRTLLAAATVGIKEISMF
jgi:hypothetical protein